MNMFLLWLIPVGIVIVVLLSCILVVEVGKLMIRHDRNRLIREEMAFIEKEYRDLCDH